MPSLRSFSVVLLLWAVPLLGQGSDVFLVTDLNDRGVVAPYPLSDFFPAGDVAVFVQEKPEGQELWVTDGTAPGTRRLPVVCDPCSRLNLVASDGFRVFFFGDGALGVTDGTTRGTRTLVEPGTLDAVSSSSDEAFFAPRVAAERVFFVASDAAAGSEPWVSDGTPEGTLLLLDAFAGPQDSRPRLGPVVGGNLLFVAEAGEDGDALWRSDGTPEGTTLLMDLDPGIESGSFSAPVRLGDRALFFAENELGEELLWSTDGTTEGTHLVATLKGSVSFVPPVRVSSLVFFPASLAGGGADLWRSDGTPEGTFPVRRFETGVGALLGRGGGALVFEERSFLPSRSTVWRTDGTPEGTFALGPECGPDCDRPPRRLAESGEELFFELRDPEIGVEPWVTDGTVEGTHPVSDVCPGPCSSEPEFVLQGPDALVLTAEHPQFGRELYSVPRDAPLRRLTTFLSAEPLARTSSTLFVSPSRLRLSRGLVLPQGGLFAAAEPGDGFSLYLTNGTAESTRRLVELAPAGNVGSEPMELTEVGGELLFTATDGVLPRRLWRTDGSAGATEPLGLFSVDPQDGGPFEPVSVTRYEDGYLVWVRDPKNRFTLWRWTPAGLSRLVDDLPGISRLYPSPPPPLVVAEERIFFATQERDFSDPALLWVSDGTAEGTHIVRNFTQIVHAHALHIGLEPFGDRLAFVASADRGQVRGVWISDGTDAGTRLVFEEPRPPQVGLVDHLVVAGERLFVFLLGGDSNRWFGIEGSGGDLGEARELASFDTVSDSFAVGSRLYFVAGEGLEHELWTSDGTETGTKKLSDVGVSNLTIRFNNPLGILDDTIFLLDADRILATDGTPAGTKPLDVLPGGVRPTGLVTAGSHLVIETTDRDEKRLWISEGGASPARRLTPIFAETDLSELVVVDTLAFFPADDGDTGLELWALDLTTPPPTPCEPSPRTLCLTEGRFRVEVDWHDPRSGNSGQGFVVPGAHLSDSGFFWFFDEDNVELVVKVLDARPVNGHFWVFSGSLTDVERTIAVTDTQTGITNTYRREAGDPTGQIDVTGF